MRASATAMALLLGISAATPSDAADLYGEPRYGAPAHAPPAYGRYLDCGRPRVPYQETAYGPLPSSRYFGPLGYYCIGGVYAYRPYYSDFRPRYGR